MDTQTHLKQQGFTLIELIVVIVVLGILAATALPKFVDLGSDAKRARSDGVAGAVASSASIQYSASLVSTGYAYSRAAACSGSYLQGNAFPTGANCSGTLSGTSCTITCDSVGATSAVDLP